MSRAFVRDDDAGASGSALPDRLISEHRNFVTREGLAVIDGEVARFAKDYGTAQANGDRTALDAMARELRYWSARRASAEVQSDPPADGRVHFGSRVEIERADGRRPTYRIVGEDEADPAKGTISYVSPLAQALMGKAVGDTVKVAAVEAEITHVA